MVKDLLSVSCHFLVLQNEADAAFDCIRAELSPISKALA